MNCAPVLTGYSAIRPTSVSYTKGWQQRLQTRRSACSTANTLIVIGLALTLVRRDWRWRLLNADLDGQRFHVYRSGHRATPEYPRLSRRPPSAQRPPGGAPGTVAEDEEGLGTMDTLGRNMAWLLQLTASAR